VTTPATISASILATLAANAPQLSCAVGTPERQIIDACAAQISAAYISQYLTGGMMNINTLSGLQLDEMIGIFGFGRLQGSAATGTVTVTLTNVAASAIAIPVGSQFSTTPGLAGLSTTLYYTSTQATVIPAGSFTVTIPVKCSDTGTQGNVPPDSITSQSAAIGSSVTTNTAAMTGGTDAETDSQLRQRFQATFLRNVSGTQDWYESVALQNNNVARVAVYGPVTLYATQLAVPNFGDFITLPVAADVKFVWNDGNSCFNNLGTAEETFFSPVNDFNLSSGYGAPNFTNLTDGALTEGAIVDLEFQYTTQSSRNDPGNTDLEGAPSPITNKVDVFVDGVGPFSVTETTVMPTTQLSSTEGTMLYYGNFERVGSNLGAPSPNNYFMRLGSVPIVSFPSTITVQGTTYTQGVNYFLLQPNYSFNNKYTTLRGSQMEIAGLEWVATASPPAANTQLVLNYVYNQVPQLLDAVMRSSKQICTDVLNHQAQYQYYTTCLTVEYSRNYAISTTNTAIVARLQAFYQTLNFRSPVIFSQLEAAVQQVLGVNEVHVTTALENDTNYGIQVFNSSLDTTPASVQTTDFVLNDNQIAVYQDCITRQAPNIGGGGS